MKQTAVEWLWSQLPSDIYKHFLEEFDQAKSMEKEQIIETAKYYFHERGKLTPEQYYNENFKSE